MKKRLEVVMNVHVIPYAYPILHRGAPACGPRRLPGIYQGAAVFLAVAIAVSPAFAGKLDKVRDEVRGSDDDNDDDDSSSDDDGAYHHDYDDCCHDDRDYDSAASSDRTKVGPLAVSIHFGAEYAYDVDRVHRPGFHVTLDTPWTVGFDMSWMFLLEPLPGRIDYLTFGDANLTLSVVHPDRFELRTGVGARWMLDAGRADGGFNLTLGLRAFPHRLIVVSIETDSGTLGKAFLVHGRLTWGIRIWRVLEIYAGYDVLRIGDVTFHGPVTGLQFCL